MSEEMKREIEILGRALDFERFLALPTYGYFQRLLEGGENV
jgi:hypothetical protein